MNTKTEGVRKLWDRYKYAVAVVLIGAALLLWPNGKEDTATTDDTLKLQETEMAQDLPSELEEILATMSGVGQVRVLLTQESDGERQLAQDTELTYSGNTAAPEDYSRRSEAVLVDGASGNETVVIKKTYPTYRGALIVCQGGDRPEIQLAVTQAVAVLTGLPADRITVAKWQ